MAMITRVARLFRADFHAVLDRIEEPDVLLKQAVREMEEDVARDEQRRKAATRDQAQLAQRRDELDDTLRQIEDQLDVCFDSDEEELARTLIRRRLEVQQLHKAAAGRHETVARTITELDERLRDNRSRLAAMRQNVELYAEQDDAGVDEPRPEITVRDEDVEVAFLREKQHRGRP